MLRVVRKLHRCDAETSGFELVRIGRVFCGFRFVVGFILVLRSDRFQRIGCDSRQARKVDLDDLVVPQVK